MRSWVPEELRRTAFPVARARRAGLKWNNLQTKDWTRLGRGQYVWSGLRPDAELHLNAAALRMPPQFAFSGATAAWIWGLDMPPCDPIEVTIARSVPVRARAGIRVRRAALEASDVVIRRGFRTTSPLRTVCDLASRRDLVESVVALDMALRAGLVNLATMANYTATHGGQKGVKRLRRTVGLADAGAESPMETRLRMDLITARLPNPCVQVPLHDASGKFIARADLYYPDCRLVIEYDGENHKERLVPDLRRQNALVNAGYHVLRFTAADLRVSGAAAAQVRRARALQRK